MRICFVLIFLTLNTAIPGDPLLEAMFADWSMVPDEVAEADDRAMDYDNGEAEVYHWELGTPDNIPEIEIIYEESPCRL